MYFDRCDPLKGEPLSILAPDGSLREDLRPNFPDDRAVEFYERMTVMRLADRMAMTMQREGNLGTYAPFYGQEACQASAAFLQPGDWLAPSYRETGALFLRGVPLANLYRYWMGDERGMLMPEGLRNLPIAVVVGAQALHAVGVAWAMKLKGEAGAAAVYFGDGASSQGDVHEAMNFAGVFKTPTVFICQNNQFAISLPRRRQTAAATIAQRAAGYGFPGLLIDGNDIFAVAGAMQEALAEARAGLGPRFIEMLTYRLGPHTTADDPRKYRSDEELAEQKRFDPLARLRVYLENRGLWSRERQDRLEAAGRAEVEAAARAALEAPPPDPADIFSYVYRRPPPYLERQRKELPAEGPPAAARVAAPA
ncbi:MAG: pyruvate dehydrogenase (acetyl-transferring) E1 component subunit alpha [Elusimicrobia bacterium]|nr:pyruvate dehydrogenase (acetyl-transferring) E1 component subunit alpha [Elusimicrobiota bacterium]